MATYYQDIEYAMWIDFDQCVRIDNAMQNDESTKYLARSRWRMREFLLRHSARYGELIPGYYRDNPHGIEWKRELIFDTEQDAVMFCLKVL